MQTSSANASNNQAQKAPRRRLEHLADLQEGADKFDMVPRCLSRAYFDKKIPEPKYKLLRIMMSHGEYFRVKRTYLEERVSKASLAKYLPQLVSEGYLECESIASTRGGYENTYHVRSLYDWPLYRQSVDRSPIDRRLIDDHKDTNPSYSSTDSNPQSETKTETTPSNGGVSSHDQPSVIPTNERIERKSAPPLKGFDVVTWVEQMKFTYRCSDKGNYHWRVANEAAKEFCRDWGPEACSILLTWARGQERFKTQCVTVDRMMYEKLWAEFSERERRD